VTRLAKQRLSTLLLASTLALAAPSAHAIDLVVHASMVVKALKAQVFKDKGRYYLQRPDRCNDPYLENPTVSFKQGRVYVGAHFAGRIGGLIGGVCQSATEPSAIMLSARPVVRAQQAALEDVRLESADKPMVAALLQPDRRQCALTAAHRPPRSGSGPDGPGQDSPVRDRRARAAIERPRRAERRASRHGERRR